jgi:hypothetical protein
MGKRVLLKIRRQETRVFRDVEKVCETLFLRIDAAVKKEGGKKE